MAKVTVGIPAYRTEFLVEAVSSALTQSFADFELLISDDSLDLSVSELVARFRDPRIRLIEGPRQGPARNSAHVWANAASPFVKFLHDDDRLYPQALEELLRVMEKDARHLFAFSHRDVIDAFGRTIRQPQHFQGQDWMQFQLPVIAEYLASRVINPVGEPTTMLIRREAFPTADFLHSFAGFEIHRLVDLAVVLNSVGRAGCAAASTQRLCAVRQHGAQLNSDRERPGFAASLYEWEIGIRGAVQTRLVSPKAAVAGLAALDDLYRQKGAGFEEIDRFRAALPQLRARLGGGRTDALDDDFAAAVAQAEAAAARGSGRVANAPADVYKQGEQQRARLVVDRLSRRRTRGWAWVPETPEKPVRIEVLVDGRVIGQQVANLERTDLRDIGTGRYGFEFAFEEPILGDGLPTFRAVLDEEEFSAGAFTYSPMDETPAPAGGAGSIAVREHTKFTAPGPDFEAFRPDLLADRSALTSAGDPLVLAFYLSQFHAIPENDLNWGPGFTEWRQLARGAPRFPGHYQPRIPRDLGFYNLLDPAVMRRQAELARAAGVGAFAFYYYWFDGKRVLERPIEQFLQSDLAMPFLLIWANENWTRTWDGGDRDILLEQRYRAEDEDALLADLARHMRDPRYLRLEGRPLFVIYRLLAIPEPEKTLERWRRKWERDHGLNPLIFMSQTFDAEDPRPYGLDGAMEFPPHKLTARVRKHEVLEAFSGDFQGIVTGYDDVIRASLDEPAPAFPLIKSAIPSWDNDSRRPNRGHTVAGSTPQKYKAWLQALVERAIDLPLFGRPVVAVNAWNEWAEGAYLEPDVHYGSAYLNATARALRDAVARNTATNPGRTR